MDLTKEVVRSQIVDLEKNGELWHINVLISTVVNLSGDSLGDTNIASAINVLVFVLEIIETNQKLRVSIEIESSIATIKQCLGDLPFYTLSEEWDASYASKKLQQVTSVSVSVSSRSPVVSSKKVQQVTSVTVSSRSPVVLADGTYATQSAASETALSPPLLVRGSVASGNLRSLLSTGVVFLAAVTSCTLTKLVFRLEEVQPSNVEVNKSSTQAPLIMISMLQLGQSSYVTHPIDDSYGRIVICIRLLNNTGDDIRKIWLQSCRLSFVKMLLDKQLRETEEIKANTHIAHAQTDDLTDIYHLKSRKCMCQLELEDEVQDDLKRATGELETNDANKLNRILQLTGFSDPVYAEAYVTVHHYDIVLDVTIINRTKETLQNLYLELAVMGDLKLVERPQNYTLTPESSKQIKANIKVSSTETGVISGNIVYATSNVLEQTVIVVIDIMDYISPAVCSDAAFRTMWAEFEWENKVAVNTLIQDENEVLDHIIESTNMKCLTALSALDGEWGVPGCKLVCQERVWRGHVG